MTKPFSVFVPPWVATLEKGEKEGCVYCCILRFAVILNLAYVSHTHTPSRHFKHDRQVFCYSIAAVVIFMTSRLHTHTHTHRTLIHTPTTRLLLGIPLFYCLLFCNPFSESSNKSSSFCYLLTLRKRKNIKGTARVCVCGADEACLLLYCCLN